MGYRLIRFYMVQREPNLFLIRVNPNRARFLYVSCRVYLNEVFLRVRFGSRQELPLLIYGIHFTNHIF
ncbi:hypothetical protein HanIR_Chr11g0507431 [Helianthus annuus]|nr:hypothetical protein HanIR_Chr11g0507431 [Helianthus annuus]